MAQPDNLWAPATLDLENGTWKIVFAHPLTLKDTAKVTVGGVSQGVPVVEEDGVSIVVSGNTDSTVVISGIKYADLFPSYSFTFTITLE